MAKKLNFFVASLLMFVILIALIRYIFDMHGWKFYIELIITLGLLGFAFLAAILIFNNISFGYVLAAITSVVALLNFMLIYFKSSMSTLLFLAIISSITAFVVSVVNIGEEKVKKEKPKQEKKIVKTYIPGKVVASKTSNVYHVPKCDWAKKIRKNNQQWFDTDEDARKAGLKPHECAK